MLVASMAVLCCTTVSLGEVAGDLTAADEKPWDRRDGDFRARLGITLAPRALVTAFDAPNGRSLPDLAETDSVVPYQEFGIFVLFSGCEPNAAGDCNATSTYEIFLPDGTLAVKRDNLPVWQWQAPARGHVQLSRALWVTSAEASDPPGINRIRATVTDHVANKTVVLERPLVLERP